MDPASDHPDSGIAGELGIVGEVVEPTLDLRQAAGVVRRQGDQVVEDPRPLGRVALEGAGDRAGQKIAAWEDDPMIGTATFVMLIAATAIADNAYPPCTQQRTDNC